jgi:hypothetical protein
MALNLKLDVINNQFQMLLSDFTGDYNATTNPEGWGSPNTTRASVTAIDCTVLRPSQTVANTITGLYTSTFWTAAYRQTDIFTQLPAIVDGLYTVTVTFNPGGSQFVDTFYFLRYEDAKKTLAGLALENSDKFQEAKFIFDKMVYAEDAENFTLAQTLLTDFNNYVAGCGPTGLSGGCSC